ncbi:MAG: P-loop NTPase [Hyphomicrobiales bacterium]
MSFKIAIASGKGGTGKTTISVNLAQMLSEKKDVLLADCDVEEPNASIFFSKKQLIDSLECNKQIPEINTKNCTFCRKCVEYCVFNALSIIPELKFQQVHADLCHSCGACSIACKYDAITEVEQQIGFIQYFKLSSNLKLAEGRLKIGSPMQTMMISQLKDFVEDKADILIYDAPPGTSCPMVETVADANFVVLVTEPTPFGLYDLKLAIEVLRQIKIPFGVFINKAGLGSEEIYSYLKLENIKLLGEVPFAKDYASRYAEGNLFSSDLRNISKCYKQLIFEIERRLG